MKRQFLKFFWLLAVAVLSQAQTQQPQQQPPVVEEGKFVLHKFEQAIGEETYKVTRDGAVLTLSDDFKFVDRGSAVPLSATLSMNPDLTPREFHIKGRISRFSAIEESVQGRTAGTVTIAEKEPFFDVEAYAPVSVQMMMVRYWRSHGSPKTMKTLPRGSVQIEDQGAQEFTISGHKVSLHKLTVRGVMWGMESLWTDAQDHVVAMVACDAEFDHFEALADGYEDGLTAFVSAAAQDGMANLARMASTFSAPASPVLAIVGGRLVDGNGGTPLENSVVIIRDGKIAAAGPAKIIPVPRGAQIVNAAGKSVLPGLWEMHAHFEQVEWGPIYLATGVTTARDVGNEREFIISARDSIASGKGIGPRLLAAGIVDGSGPMALGIIRVDTPEQAREQVRRYKQEGFQQIKIYSSVKPDIVKVITEEAHAQGMTVTGHVPNGMTVLQGIDDGMDQINHIQYPFASMIDPQTRTIVPDSPRVKAVVDAMLQHHTVLDPTMVVFETTLRPANVPLAQEEPGIEKVAPELREPLESEGVPAERAAQAQRVFDMFLQSLSILHKAGVPIVVGTDQSVPGYSVYREMELYVKAGFTPMEAIQSATIVPARVMGMEKDSGSIEPGKRGDVILVDGNPDQNISDIRKVSTVIASGRVFQPGPLWQAVGFKP